VLFYGAPSTAFAWTNVKTLGGNYGGVAFANGTFFAMGNYGTSGYLQKSTDLVNWTPITGTSYQVMGVGYAGSN